MLRSRSRKPVSRKQGFMAAEENSVPSSPTQSPTKPVSSFLGSPRIFNGFLGRAQSGGENGSTGMSISPTSTLDGKQFLNLGHPFGYDRSPSPSPTHAQIQSPNREKKPDSAGVGLALIDSNGGENRTVLFGSKLKIQIPPLVSTVESPPSPADFGLKTPRNSPFLSSSSPPKECPQSLSEMELSEDYTCVITHGPNPKTTHIFDNCVVESCCGVTKLSKLKTENVSVSSSTPLSFLRFCHGCNMSLGDGGDIYMYRGEKAFCSHECRSEERVLEGMKKNEEMDDGL